MRVQASEILPQGERKRADGAARKDHQLEAERLQLGRWQDRRLAAFDHVRHDRDPHAETPRHRLQLLARARRFDEQEVGARIDVKGGALERTVEPFDRDGVRAGNDQRLRRAPGVERCLDLADHLARTDERLVGQVTAALGRHLILDLQRRSTPTFELADRALDVERIAEPGVDIDNHRQSGALADRRQRVGDLGHRH